MRKNKRAMTRVRNILFAIMIVAASSCDKLVSDELNKLKTSDDENCDCYLYEKPESYDVQLRITINDANPQVPVTVFFGNVERKNIATTLTASETVVAINLKTNHDYTYQAKYLKGSDTVYVPIKARLSTDTYVCQGDTCWRVNNNVINLKLK